MTIVKQLKNGLTKGESTIDLARKIFLSYQTQVFRKNEDVEFKIKDSIKNHLKIPFLSIQVAGSAKTGFSFFNQTLFTPGKSDLDVSILSLELYNRFLEVIHAETKGFTDLTVFPLYYGKRTDSQFLSNMKKGFINPFFMPDCTEKTEWLDFFRHLSNNYYKLFKNINAGIYASEYFFEYKQTECIDEFKGKMKEYDSLPSKV